MYVAVNSSNNWKKSTYFAFVVVWIVYCLCSYESIENSMEIEVDYVLLLTLMRKSYMYLAENDCSSIAFIGNRNNR